MEFGLRKQRLCLSALVLSGIFAQAAFADNFSGAASGQSLFGAPASRPAPAAHKSSHVHPHPVRVQRSVSKPVAPARATKKGKGKAAVNQSASSTKLNWTAAGATNLDAIKESPGAAFLLSGPTIDLGDAGNVFTKFFSFLQGKPAATESSGSQSLLPVLSNEFGLHCFLPKDILKAKFSERVEGFDINVNVVGSRHGKNEMVVGYAHLPIDELLKKKQAQANAFTPAFGAKMIYYFDVNKGLDGCVDAAAKRADFKIKFRCPIKVQGNLPGREYEGTASHGRLVRGRVFMGYNNYYHAVVAGEPAFVNSKDAYKFLESMDVH
ncbi:MAG: hypothetical protein C0507_00730 [Cyanobacteria bacterium PR.3.49]|nr:hypothetical protein [Cyanobacteria bacterium PR.3.49]